MRPVILSAVPNKQRSSAALQKQQRPANFHHGMRVSIPLRFVHAFCELILFQLALPSCVVKHSLKVHNYGGFVTDNPRVVARRK